MFLQLLVLTVRGLPHLEVVATAQTVAGGVDACARHRPDLLLLELALIDGPGLTVARELTRVNPDGKLIILSAQTSAFNCPASLESCLHAVVDKTQGFDAVALELERLIAWQRRRGSNSGSNQCTALSQRERQIFLLMGRGLLSKEIAEKLSVSLHTVQSHRKMIARKLGTVGPELVQRAMRHYHAELGAQTNSSPAAPRRFSRTRASR